MGGPMTRLDILKGEPWPYNFRVLSWLFYESEAAPLYTDCRWNHPHAVMFNEVVEEDETAWRRILWRLSDDAIAWLEEKGASCKCYLVRRSENAFTSLRYDFWLEFDTPEHAMLFKLTWL